jgi:ketosteroid isomerase-like protein
MSESNADLARRGYEAAVRGDLDFIGGLLAPDVVWHGGDPNDVGACHDREEALHFMRQAFARGGVGELVDVIDAGDRVVVIMQPPSTAGRQVALIANLSTFRDGKVIEMVHYPDPDDALAAARG